MGVSGTWSDKLCTKCKQPGEYYSREDRKDKLYSHCVKCHAVMTKNYFLKNKEKVTALHKAYEKKASTRRLVLRRKYMMKRLFGMTLEQFEAMSIAQNNLCFICGGEQKPQLYIDHNHKTGKIRKLLCNRCNTALGFVKESTRTLRKMQEYLIMYGSAQ